jgi:N-glycosidase YbiA
MTEIRFNRKSPKYRSFSNFSKHPIVVDEAEWPTVEHYYQAQKFFATERIELIRITSSPAEARKLGREKGHPIRPNWDDIRDDVMFEALLAKFRQHPEIATVLLSTGDALLVEDNPFDSYWGCGRDGNGKNRLGLCLMKVRELLRKQND